jgi:hypothetical protein
MYTNLANLNLLVSKLVYNLRVYYNRNTRKVHISDNNYDYDATDHHKTRKLFHDRGNCCDFNKKINIIFFPILIIKIDELEHTC